MDMDLPTMPWRGWAGAVALMILLSACAQAGTGTGGKTTDGTRGGRTGPAIASSNQATSVSCRLPAQLTPNGHVTMGGPASTALTGGPVTQPFRLDGGSLRVDEPRPGDRPEISGPEAECVALASIGADGVSFGDLALAGGVRIGLARVTVDDSVATASNRASFGDGDVPPDVGPTPANHDRMAWVVVVVDEIVVPCPMIPPSRPMPNASSRPKAVDPSPSHGSTDFDYLVFLVDARSGADALTYTEGRPALCGGPGRLAPSVSVPADWVSVVWSLTARNPDGYSATITADMLACDGYDPLVLPDEQRPAVVRVLVQRPIGRSCGPVLRRRLTLHAAVVTASLPAKLVHAPTGLSVPSSDPAVQPSLPR